MNEDQMLVMVVEDEELLLKAIEIKLEKSGKKVIACISAGEAMTALKSKPRLPDIIWLDYYLKDMNGLQFVSMLKANPEWANIPVIVVSNSASTDKVSQMLALGVNKYYLKAESRLEDLVDMLEEITSGKGGA